MKFQKNSQENPEALKMFDFAWKKQESPVFRIVPIETQILMGNTGRRSETLLGLL
jgi:hypothetical protein